jgi:hypothetical protein
VRHDPSENCKINFPPITKMPYFPNCSNSLPELFERVNQQRRPTTHIVRMTMDTAGEGPAVSYSKRVTRLRFLRGLCRSPAFWEDHIFLSWLLGLHTADVASSWWPWLSACAALSTPAFLPVAMVLFLDEFFDSTLGCVCNCLVYVVPSSFLYCFRFYCLACGRYPGEGPSSSNEMELDEATAQVTQLKVALAAAEKRLSSAKNAMLEVPSMCACLYTYTCTGEHLHK